MVVIAPRDVPVHVRHPHTAVLRFSSSDEFERWREGSSARVEEAVDAALHELGIVAGKCSPRTQEVLARLKARETIPSVKELVGLCSSRRSFYRWWTRDLRESPAVFLERVRLLHLRTKSTSENAAQLGTPGQAEVVR